MKLNNKKIIAILLAAATLTACDSLSGNKKEAEPADTKVEESAENKADQTTEAEGEEKAADEKEADKETKDGEESEEAKEGEEEAITDEGKSAKEKLEDAVFKTRVTARAAELLIEQTPETITGIREDLEELLQQSQEQIDKANELLESM
ncbi:hypothetical protein [uncultured Anaerococcus sp.]|uniref:hypothetical protein n=1 Tax=uncultured Anaerococcus sp. TaxID=293428 RepID=UPI0025D5834B|nr:hypothetical protein [uncultured Anaerococcus sp.]